MNTNSDRDMRFEKAQLKKYTHKASQLEQQLQVEEGKIDNQFSKIKDFQR